MDQRTFVGRQPEMEELRAGLEEARSGRGRLLLISGEAGIGKTRIAEELADHAASRACTVLWGRCREVEGAPASWPWVQVIRSYCRQREPSELTSEMGIGAADIAQVVPEIRSILGPLPENPSLDAEAARFRYFDSATNFLCNAARRRPLAIILDDIHCTDRASILLLQFLAAEIGEAPLLVIATFRDVDAGSTHPLVEALAELTRLPLCKRIALMGMSASEVERLIEITAGIPPPQALAEAVHRDTDGNPFFVREIAQSLISEGRLLSSGEVRSFEVTVPQTVREVVAHRLSQLSAECQAVLAIAATMGRRFNSIVIERVSNRPSDQLIQPLEEAVAANVIAEIPGDPGAYNFSHALVRQAVYEGLPSLRRVRLHLEIGEALEEIHAADIESQLDDLSYHFCEAATAGGASRAVEYARRAGDRAMDRLAFEQACLNYERALRALELQGGEGMGRFELLLSLGEAWFVGGDTPRSRETFRRALDIARRLGEPELIARAVLGTARGLAAGDYDEQDVALLEEAIASLGPADNPLRARLLARLSEKIYFTDAVERRDYLSREAVDVARRAGDASALAFALNARRLALWGLARAAERVGVTNESLELAERIRDEELAWRAHYWRFIDYLELGDIQAANSAHLACDRMAKAVRHPYSQFDTVFFAATLAQMEGRLAEAEETGQQAFAAAQRVRDPDAHQFAAILMFALRRDQGRLHELEPAAKALVERYPRLPAWRCALAYIYSELGRREEARDHFEPLAGNGFADLPKDNSWLSGISLLSEVCVFLGDSRHAETMYDLLLPYDGHNVVVSNAIAFNGPVSHYLGLLATLMERWPEAERHFRAAIEMSTRMGAGPFVARAQTEYAGMLLRRGQAGDGARAAEMLESAQATAEELGMRGLAEKIVRIQERSGEAATSQPGGLTAREVDVLRRVAAGKSNREIAADLFLSVRTVERHITNIYHKIGASNRAQATAFALFHGLLSRTED